MTNYHINSTSLPSLAAQQAKQERKLLLERVRKQRQRQEQERRKHQQQALTTSGDYREYQEWLKEEANLYR